MASRALNQCFLMPSWLHCSIPLSVHARACWTPKPVGVVRKFFGVEVCCPNEKGHKWKRRTKRKTRKVRCLAHINLCGLSFELLFPKGRFCKELTALSKYSIWVFLISSKNVRHYNIVYVGRIQGWSRSMGRLGPGPGCQGLRSLRTSLNRSAACGSFPSAAP